MECENCEKLLTQNVQIYAKLKDARDHFKEADSAAKDYYEANLLLTQKYNELFQAVRNFHRPISCLLSGEGNTVEVGNKWSEVIRVLEKHKGCGK